MERLKENAFSLVWSEETTICVLDVECGTITTMHIAPHSRPCSIVYIQKKTASVVQVKTADLENMCSS